MGTRPQSKGEAAGKAPAAIPLPLRGRRVTPWVPRNPCVHRFTAFIPLEDYLKLPKKLSHDCAVRQCMDCGMVTGAMW